eukprot:SAG11_NODE_459_length_9261_cov_7.747463_9_plen_118_part_00
MLCLKDYDLGLECGTLPLHERVKIRTVNISYSNEHQRSVVLRVVRLVDGRDVVVVLAQRGEEAGARAVFYAKLFTSLGHDQRERACAEVVKRTMKCRAGQGRAGQGRARELRGRSTP